MPQTKRTVHGLILAGGQSSRMGTDKALLPIEGKPLLYRLAAQLSECADTLTVAIGSSEREAVYGGILGKYAAGARMVADRIPDCGPLSGLEAGLSAIADGYAFVVACDMPRLSLPLLQKLINAAAESGADVVHVAGQPFHALYHTRTVTEIRRSLEAGDYRLMGLLSRLKAHSIERQAGESPDVFANLNTPDDYKMYRAD
ncbi:molybdenum cofactor guanylyltransferase [Paenibacillus arenilitoris]|uniref:Probable molybdenum cofactor guanylyltransferase n=1 Tax=Paenibacillus arenilitoris TaxID=2772299 RepID=A0A927CKA5_9BACL|nr:molybdenum cofactor guanylyltransferase [Paenibacillus arenilitoris]MBD2868297.1 molybdenum cofactor guanylyltransferase [Paenibacillus arenilitoris]